MAVGSAKELLRQLMRAGDLKFLPPAKYQEFEPRIDEIRRMLWPLAAEVRKQHRGDQ